jgi:hypothetical protein
LLINGGSTKEEFFLPRGRGLVKKEIDVLPRGRDLAN